MTPTAPDPREASRQVGLREAAFFAAMQGGGENYLSAFALLLHATTFQIGLLSSLPQLIGAWMQLLSVTILHRVERRKTVILLGAGGQAIMWIPLLVLPLLFPDAAAWLLIVCAVGYFAMGHVMVPAWNSVMADLIDDDGRGRYFSRRHRIIAVAGFLALCGAGLVLHGAERLAHPAAGFAVIFLVAAAARAHSARLLGRLDDLGPDATREAPLRGFAYLRRDRARNFRWFLLFSGLMHVSVMIAGPYFVVYMLRDLHFTYLQYTAWLAAQLVGQLISLQRWGKLGDRFGNKKVLAVTGVTVPIIPMLYLISDRFYFVIAVSFVGGVIWAGLSLALQNYVFDVVAPEDRAKSVAMLNSVNAAGWFLGAMLGSALATGLPAHLSAAGVTVRWASNLPLVFFVSGVLRLAISVGLLRTFHEGRRVEPVTVRDLFVQLPLIKPLTKAFAGSK